jgi:transglutaminase-like putative cysteine protease
MILQYPRSTGALLCALIFLTVLPLLHAENPTILVGERPTWVEPSRLDLAAASLASEDTEVSNTGLSFLLLDRQIDVATQAVTTHIVYRITSQAGLSEGAKISELFDPTYESVEYHYIRLWRNGAAQDRLVASDFKILQQERELDRQLYNGMLSAVLLLRDIRVGDIVEYSRTTRGANPVFAGKFIDTQSLGWASPLNHQRLRVLVPSGRNVLSRLHGQNIFKSSQRTLANSSTEITWEAHKIPAINGDADAPAWFVQYPYLELSEFTDWKDVAEWARSLYNVKESTSDSVREKARELTRGLTQPSDRALALLDFVQREVRYLGIELGPNSHQPHEPAEVLSRRFGDCKDKVFLLCALLDEVGIQAKPILVNTYQTRTIDERLPSPYVFNHVVAGIELGGTTYIVDPTRSYQRGPLTARGPTEEAKGLVVGAILNEDIPLLTIPVSPDALPRIETHQVYTTADYQQPVSLSATYRFSGNSAESMRYYLSNTTHDAITRDYLDGMKRSHPQVDITQPLTWTDNDSTNEIELTLTVAVSGLWKSLADGDAVQAEFYPWALQRNILQPETLTRDSPLWLNHPVHMNHRTEVKFNDDWALSESSKIVTSPWYKFVGLTKYANRTYEMYYAWESFSDHVPRDQLSTHVAKLDEIRNYTGYTLTRNLKIGRQLENYTFSWVTALLTGLLLGGWLWFAIWMNTRPTQAIPPPIADQKFAGIGGWLIVASFGVIIRPLTLTSSFVQEAEPYFDQRTWLGYTSTDFSTYQPAMAVLLGFELVVNISLICLSIVTAIMFFRRKQQLPTLMITLLAGLPIASIIDHVWASALSASSEETSHENIKVIFQGIVGALIWIPYFCISRRVKATFIR